MPLSSEEQQLVENYIINGRQPIRVRHHFLAELPLLAAIDRLHQQAVQGRLRQISATKWHDIGREHQSKPVAGVEVKLPAYPRLAVETALLRRKDLSYVQRQAVLNHIDGNSLLQSMLLNFNQPLIADDLPAGEQALPGSPALRVVTESELNWMNFTPVLPLAVVKAPRLANAKRIDRLVANGHLAETDIPDDFFCVTAAVMDEPVFDPGSSDGRGQIYCKKSLTASTVRLTGKHQSIINPRIQFMSKDLIPAAIMQLRINQFIGLLEEGATIARVLALDGVLAPLTFTPLAEISAAQLKRAEVTSERLKAINCKALAPLCRALSEADPSTEQPAVAPPRANRPIVMKGFSEQASLRLRNKLWDYYAKRRDEVTPRWKFWYCLTYQREQKLAATHSLLDGLQGVASDFTEHQACLLQGRLGGIIAQAASHAGFDSGSDFLAALSAARQAQVLVIR